MESETLQMKSNPISIKPAGLIPEFNALGNHPSDMVAYVDDHILPALQRLGMESKFPEVREVLVDALKELSEKDEHFSGHHVPTEKTKAVLDFILDTFFDVEKCGYFGRENFELAQQLTEEGNNVLIIQNHMSPVDAFLPFALMREEYGEIPPMSVIMSQVFEYARITNLVTSGLNKFPVFQPKHMKRFTEQPEVVTEMCRQNSVTLRSLLTQTKQGGQMIFLYPEKNRNSQGMGVVEPSAQAIPEIISRSNKPLYILPTMVSGLGSVFPNSPGRNELDDYFEIITRGRGDFYCGKPFLYSDLVKVVDSLSENEIEEILTKVTDTPPETDKDKRKAAVLALMMGSIARIKVNAAGNGFYGDEKVQKLVDGCYTE